MKHIVKILMTGFVTHDVKRFILEKPAGYVFEPGQATDVSINNPELRDETRPFTFTSLNDDKVIEFTIKGYPSHHGITEKLHKLKPGDTLSIEDPWGTIAFKGNGVFIAGGAGITPFIAILRQLYKDGKLPGNKLLFSNKTSKDVILWQELSEMLHDDLVLTFSDERVMGHNHGRIDKAFLEKHIKNFNQPIYICGPPLFIESIQDEMKSLGANTFVLEA
jgi:ferredoxin-NADP reductase